MLQNDKMKFTENVGVSLIKKPLTESCIKLEGFFIVEHYDCKGNLKGIHKTKNVITNVGKNSILDVGLGGVAQIDPWYIGLVNNAGFTAFAVTDTMSSHAGWTEWQSYTEANRVEWTSGAATAQSITNATPADFNQSASGTLKGIFITSNNTKGGTTGTLWSGASFATPIVVANTDLLKITYTVSAG